MENQCYAGAVVVWPKIQNKWPKGKPHDALLTRLCLTATLTDYCFNNTGMFNLA